MPRVKLCSLALATVFALSQTVQAQNDLPSAKDVIDNYIKKTGGEKRYKAVKNVKIKGKMSVPAAGIEGTVNIVYVAPRKFHFKADMGGLGTQERGSDGKVIWETSTVQGPRLIEGDEADQLMQEITMASILSPESYYKSMKTVGKEKVNGDECYVLELTRKNGDVDKDFYSVKTGLKVKSVKQVETPLNKIPVSSFDSNYKKSKYGITTAWTSEQKIGPNSIFVKMSSVEFNTDLGGQSFELPAEVKELID